MKKFNVENVKIKVNLNVALSKIKLQAKLLNWFFLNKKKKKMVSDYTFFNLYP